MSKTIFEYTDYKVYLTEKIHSLPSRGRGVKLKIAEYLHCQNTFISQIFKGDPHFSLEQGIKLNTFFDHSKEEGKYFLNLIHLARAGSDDLKQYYQQELSEIVLKNSDLKKRTNIKNGLKEKDQDIYYSSWLYSAIHILITIKEFRSPQSIARKFNLSKDKVIEILDFLIVTGLIIKEGNNYVGGETRLHLGKNSAHIQKHHTNWRIKAMNSIDMNLEKDLHFSNVVSMSEKDIVKVRELFIKAIGEARAIIKESPEEKLQSICLDFFEV
jgi:uncharacterized protein (TIGR02147 family)